MHAYLGDFDWFALLLSSPLYCLFVEHNLSHQSQSLLVGYIRVDMYMRTYLVDEDT